MRRRLVTISLGCLAGALIALATLPWWLSPVLEIVGHRFGTEFVRYERLGYSRFALLDVTFVRSTTRVHADRVETETPLVWLMHRWSGHPALISVTRWRVDVKARETSEPPPAGSEGGARSLRVLLFKIATALDRWVPRAEIGAGVVSWPGASLQLDEASWGQRTLTVRPLHYGTVAAEVRATFAKNDELLVETHAVTAPMWQTSLKNVRDEISGQLHVWEQTAAIDAHLPEHGWMPDTIQLRAEHWAVPATELKLAPSYSLVRGDARLEWRDGKFDAAIDAAGEASTGKKAPPLAAKLHVRGDREALTVDLFAVDIPGATARLSSPVVFDRKGGMPAGASQFSLEIDLEKQPWLPSAKGRVSGRADVVSRGVGVPHIEGNFTAQNLLLQDWSVAHFSSKIILDWPRLQLDETTLGFADGGRLTLHGGWDWNKGELIEATAGGVLHSSSLPHGLPAGTSFESVTFAARAHGPIAGLEYEGNARATALKTAATKPVAIDLSWRGMGARVEVSEARVQSGDSRVTFSGTLDPKGARLTSLKFVQGTAERFALAQPTPISWSPAVAIGPLQLTGAEASVSLAAVLGETGHIDTTIRHFPSVWLTDFVEVPGPEWRVKSLDAHGQWDRGPVKFTAAADVMVSLAPERTASVSLAVQGDREGIKVETLRVSEGTSPIVNATGQLPLTFRPGAESIVQLEKASPLALHATTASNPAFWQKLTEATGLEFQEPEVNVELSGTWSRPKGEVSAKAVRVAADPKRIKFSFPTVEALDLHATADGKGIAVDRLAVQVERQTVRASGNLPFTFEQWADFKGAPLAFIRRAGSLRLEIPDAEVAAFAHYTGDFLAPAGRLHVDVELKPGGDMTGDLQLRDATTRPLGPLGVLQDVQADAQLTGRTLHLRNVGARAGGQPVVLTGKIELPLTGVPKYDLALKGENLPLVRETGLLLRADLDLKLTTENDNTTAVTGSAKLRDSMFLSDVRALIPRGGGGGPERRPPFFSVDTPPLNAWRLGVEVHGDKFLRLRSTVFVGMASAHFRLGGTLGEPRATGEATVDSGQVLLPFAVFRVEQGTVRLTEADPSALRLFVTGTSRRYGYDLRMEMTGTAADPIVTFSSSPPLDAKQVLLMVTAGELPNDEITYGNGQRVARLGTYLGQTLINNFGGDAADSDRLSIATGERVSRQGRETYDIEYRLNDRFTLVGEYDEFDDYNAGIRWRMSAPPKANDQKPAAAPKEKKEADNVPTR